MENIKMNFPLVNIIIVNFNGKQYLSNCLNSLFNLDYPKNRLGIIVVDNCSTDGSVDFIKRRYPNVVILKNDINNYARANNLGIRKAKGEYLAFINNDIRVEKDWLIEIIRVMEKKRRVGVAGCKLLFDDNRIQSSGHVEYPNFYWGDRGFKEEDIGQYENIEEVFSVCGAAIIFRKTCLKEVGFFDEDFNLYLEDLDICFRCARINWKILYIPKSIAYHNFRGTSNSELATYYSERNRLLLLAKHFPEKLSDALYGKGYFTAENKEQKNIYNLLPVIFFKLLESHDIKSIIRILPDIFKNLKNISNLEKDLLVHAIEDLKNNLEDIKKNILAKESSLNELRQDNSHLNERLQEANDLLQRTVQDNYAKESSLNELRQDNSHLNERLQKTLLDLQDKESQFQKVTQEENVLRNELNRMIRVDKKLKFLIIKPQRIDIEETEAVIGAIKRKYPNSSICLLANLIKQDYEKLVKNIYIDRKLLYQPDKNRFSPVTILKLIFIFWLARFDVALVLSSSIQKKDYSGYRKAKILSLLSCARSRHIYYVD